MDLPGDQAGGGVGIGPGFDFRTNQGLLTCPATDCHAAIVAGVNRPAGEAGDGLLADRAVVTAVVVEPLPTDGSEEGYGALP